MYNTKLIGDSRDDEILVRDIHILEDRSIGIGVMDDTIRIYYTILI